MVDLEKMASIKPFQAWRYQSSRVSIADVIAPPYDVISPAEQNQLYDRSPYNCVRLILNRQEAGDGDQSRYDRARDAFEAWKKSGILGKESKPSFYLYRQTFQDLLSGQKRLRTSILVRLKLEAFDKGVVLPHERTLEKPKRDRRRLLETAKTVFSPIFGLYQDSDHQVRNIIDKVSPSSDVFRVKDTKDVEHEFIPFSDSQSVEALQNLFAAKRIYIADGHHRYSTGLDYARDMRKQNGVPADQEMPYDFTMAALVCFEDTGLAIYPTHRIIRSLPSFDPEKATKALQDLFELQPMETKKLKQYLETSRGSSPANETLEFGLLLKGKSYLLKLKSMAQLKKFFGEGKPDVWFHLDVNILGFVIFNQLWKFTDDQWESHLEFTHNFDEAILAANKQDTSAVILLKSPTLEIVRAMCEARELMPQKSTYFYPKLASGFAFYQHD